MGGKTKRLLEIKDIIRKNKVSSQEELLSLLRGRGFELTQATLSRDMKFLKVSRVIDDEKEYAYVLPEKESMEEEKKITSSNGFLSMEFANNLAVIKTVPGFASSIAVAIDQYDAHEILGTIAGDDTILLIPREGIGQGELKRILVMIMPDLQGVI